MSANNICGLQCISNELETELYKFVKLFLIYADDTALFSESEEDLHNSIHLMNIVIFGN